jgi:hypothetical protein
MGREILRQTWEEEVRQSYLAMREMGKMINAKNWERFLREQTPSTNIEDRRTYDPTMQEGRAEGGAVPGFGG